MSEESYTGKYIKTEYNGTITMKNHQSGEMEERNLTRTVYRNSDIDPDTVIPAGTKLGNEITKEDSTNLQRMQDGKSPVLCTKDADGNVTYDKVELHHLTGEEKNPGSNYFSGEQREGSWVEISGSTHDKYSKQLHSVNEPNTSFRKDKVEKTDENGTVVRERTKSDAATQYTKSRQQYWKDRADEIIESRSAQKNKERFSETDNSQHNAKEKAKDSTEKTDSQKSATTSNKDTVKQGSSEKKSDSHTATKGDQYTTPNSGKSTAHRWSTDRNKSSETAMVKKQTAQQNRAKDTTHCWNTDRSKSSETAMAKKQSTQQSSEKITTHRWSTDSGNSYAKGQHSSKSQSQSSGNSAKSSTSNVSSGIAGSGSHTNGGSTSQHSGDGATGGHSSGGHGR